MPVHQPFLGTCEACERPVRTYRGLAGHLRHNRDSGHDALKRRWHAWRESSYTAQLSCRKCGQAWEVRDKTLKDSKRCPTCEALLHRLGKRQYEKLATRKTPKTKEPRRGTARFWDAGDALYQAVVGSLQCGEGVRSIMTRLGLTYKAVRSMAEVAFGAECYRTMVLARTRLVSAANLRKAHSQYRALSPSAKASLLKARFGGACALELKLADELRECGLSDIELNQWQSIRIGSSLVPREADIKLSLGDGRKLVILCDGEAFHGPRLIHGEPGPKIESDRQTALAFFDAGYSVARYSESEIHAGFALTHVRVLLDRLVSCRRVYRNWCPMEEVTS